jgi:hypothetical protein
MRLPPKKQDAAPPPPAGWMRLPRGGGPRPPLVSAAGLVGGWGRREGVKVRPAARGRLRENSSGTHR